MNHVTPTDEILFPSLATDIGDVFAQRYRIVRRLGQGGMGHVFEAEHLYLKHRVALKVMLEAVRDGSEGNVTRFFNEGVCGVRVVHENVACVYDAAIVEPGRVPYIVMEYLEGQDLRKQIEASEWAMSPIRALRIVEQIASALVAIHGAGIVHRDLKPENVFLVPGRDGEEIVKLLDFGVSKFVEDNPHGSQLTASNVIMGTPRYIPPEQILDAKRVDTRADLWSCGVILYELLAGERPFEADNITSLASQIISGYRARIGDHRPDLPASLVSVIDRCLEPRPEDRFQSASTLLAALREAKADVEGDVSLDAEASNEVESAPRPRPRPVEELEEELVTRRRPPLRAAMPFPEAPLHRASDAITDRAGARRWLAAAALPMILLCLGGSYWAGTRHRDPELDRREPSIASVTVPVTASVPTVAPLALAPLVESTAAPTPAPPASMVAIATAAAPATTSAPAATSARAPKAALGGRVFRLRRGGRGVCGPRRAR